MSRFLTATLDGIEITRAKDVKKHGDHDQASHGNWATGLSEETTSSIKNFTREWGGLSIKMSDGSMPTKGYMVAKPPSFGRVVSKEDFYDKDKGFQILRDYMRTHKEELATGKHYLGTWEHEGKVYLDVSENIMDETEATSLGRERNQIEIWDVANQKTINTGGTGSVEKRSKDGGTQGHLNDDRGRDGRLRQRDVGKTLKVIRFDFGLKPVLKHGEHDQSEHGNWARGFTEDEVARIKSMERAGPSLDDIRSVIRTDKVYSPDELKMQVENDSDLYQQATEDIDFRVEERLAALQAEFPLHEYSEQEKMEIYENVQRDMIDSYVQNNYDNLVEYARAVDGDGTSDPSDLVEPFGEVFNVYTTGKNQFGDEVTIESRVDNVYQDGSNLKVQGQLYDGDGELVGEFSRRFFEKNGTMNVEHELLWMFNEETKGTGFAKEMIKQSEAWYTAKGMGYIEVGTAQDGARHWARAGYDWAPNKVAENLDTISQRVASFNDDDSPYFREGSPERAEFDSLMARATDNYNPYFEDESGYKYPAWDNVKDMKADNFPLPADFANIGYKPGAKDWAGRELMADLRMKYVKSLTAEGQKLLDGPIDHDGDGMIYDGTAREKPAPSSGKN